MDTIATNVWQKSKLLVKGLLIGGLVLLLLIPAYFVQNVISEREARQKEAFNEVSSKWAGSQNITGPVLVLPYAETITGDKGQMVVLKKLAYVLPDKLTIESAVKPEERHRGIFQVMLYSSVIKLSGKFNSIPIQQLKLDPTQVLWNEAYICMELADSKGLKEEIKVTWNDSSVTLNPSLIDNAVMKEGFIAPNINFEKPDEDSARLNIISKTLEKNIDVFLSNSFGFGGTISSLIVRKRIN
jgi:inner membrane protein